MTADGSRRVTREEMHAFARRFGVSPEDADRTVTDLRFPATVDEIEERLAKVGVTRGKMMDELGGSP